MRLVALVQAPDHVCARYRLAALAPFLARAGHELELLAWRKGWFVSPSRLRTLRQADVVVVQRRLLPWWQVRILRGLARHLVFDVDDAVFLRDSYSAKGTQSASRLNGFRRMVRAADAVAAGNPFLAEHAARYTASERVRLIPTCVPANHYTLARHDDSGATTLVWVGSSSTLQGIERIVGLLDRLAQTLPNLRLRLVCDRSLTLSSLPVEFRPWSAATEAADLTTSDIGISWLPDDDWSRGKCGLKVLQYMAAGLPVLANPVGVQTDFVDDGTTGFIVRSEGDWCAALTKLTCDANLRRCLGRAGRQRVERDFDVARGAALWLDLLNDLCSKKPASVWPGTAPGMKTWSPAASAGAS